MWKGRKRAKHIFLGILALVVIYVLFLTFDGRLTFQPYMSTTTFYVAYPGNYTIIMDNTPVCRTRNPFLVLMVPVAPRGVKFRHTIRRTWGSERTVLGQRVDTIFLLGLPSGEETEQQQELLFWENEQYQDMIQSGFLDSYRNLTIKTMFMLEWLVKNCKNTSYVMKIDSDMLLHVPNLVKLLLDPITPKHNYMSGLVWWHSQVLRNPFNKFYMPRHVIAEPEYPPYPLGMAYVMSMDLPEKILSISTEIKPIYIEDAYLGMCLQHLGIFPTDPPDTDLYIVKPVHPLSNCSLTKVIAVTTTGIDLMNIYWARIQDSETTCNLTYYYYYY
ncbi:beta-1,3-galactosyltransferase 2-like isoform X2 [Cynoglossus semilaevis]|nr:beta-1,3-galactosyltransferase 2-like isoform X2 [Cynoglossus semilaevis]